MSGVDLSRYVFVPDYAQGPGSDGFYPSGTWSGDAIVSSDSGVSLFDRKVWSQTVHGAGELSDLLPQSAIPGETEVIALMVGERNTFVRCYGRVEDKEAA